MSVLDLIQAILEAQAPYVCSATATATPPSTPAGYLCDNCGGSAFTSIAAAFGTLGYWAQASWLHQIFNHSLSKIVMLAYIFSAIGGVVTFVMGGSPKQYLWLFIGPAFFYWLTEYRTAVAGVEWRVGGHPRDQRVVWKMAETGLINEDYVQRFGFSVTDSAAPRLAGGGGGLVTGEPIPCGGTNGACVSDFFAFFDQVISDTVQYLINFIGAGRKIYSSSNSSTNIIRDPSGGAGTQVYHADLMNDMRWAFFGSIGEARINNPDLRRSFASFMSSECGDQFLSAVNHSRFHAVKERQESPLYTTILQSEEVNFNLQLWPFPIWIPIIYPTEIKLWSKLVGVVPTPRDLKRLIQTSTLGGSSVGLESNIRFIAEGIRDVDPIPDASGDPFVPVPDADYVLTCKTFLQMVMQGLRWEAAKIAYQIMISGPEGMLPIDYSASMLYGMDIKYPYSYGGGSPPRWAGEPGGTQLKREHIPHFVESLVLAKLFANELQVTPAASQLVHNQYSSVAEKSIENIKDFQRVNNQKAKFGELYTWAEMLPYFQGKLLYFLAIGYPFAAMFVVLPGMFKGFVQWCQFWIWVKLWDLGFAMVTVLERSVWSITGGGSNNGEFNTLILQIAAVNGHHGTSLCSAYDGGGLGLNKNVLDPIVAVNPYYNVAGTGMWSNPDAIFYMQWMLDRLLAASGNIGLDMANTYYIYIMSALYLSVPVVTGSLVLGAKSGMASMLGSTMGGIASPAGGAAGTAGATSYSKALGSNQSTMGQEAFAKALRSGSAAGLARGAIESSNMATGEQMAGTIAGTQAQQIGAQSQAVGLNMSGGYMAYSTMGPIAQLMSQTFGTAGGIAGNKAKQDRAEARGETGNTKSNASSPVEGGVGSSPAGQGGGGGGGGVNPATEQALKTGTGVLGMGVAGGEKIFPAAVQAKATGNMNKMAGDHLGQQAGLLLAQGNKNIEGAGHQTGGALAGLAGQRGEQHADFAARDAQWEAMDNVANSGMSEQAAAITGSGGMLSAGQKPVSTTGMAMAGRFEGGSIKAGGGFQAAAGHGSMAAAHAASMPRDPKTGQRMRDKDGNLMGGSLTQMRDAEMAGLESKYGASFVEKGFKGGFADTDAGVRRAAMDKAATATFGMTKPLADIADNTLAGFEHAAAKGYQGAGAIATAAGNLPGIKGTPLGGLARAGGAYFDNIGRNSGGGVLDPKGGVQSAALKDNVGKISQDNTALDLKNSKTW